MKKPDTEDKKMRNPKDGREDVRGRGRGGRVLGVR